MLASGDAPLENFKPDLRSAKGTTIRKGLAIKLTRIALLILLDALCLTFALNLGVYYGTPIDFSLAQDTSFLLVGLAIQVVILATFGSYGAGVYRRSYFSLVKAISLSELLLLLVAFLYEPEHEFASRSTFLLSWVLSIVFISINRFFFDVTTKKIRTKGAVLYPVFLIADIHDQESSIGLINKENCYTIIGTAEPIALDRANREATLQILRDNNIAELFVSWDAIKNRPYVCWTFLTSGITLRILPQEKKALPSASVWMIGELPCQTINAPIIPGADFLLKRCFDRIFSFLFLLTFSPIYLLIALLIRLDSPGPIFFKQERIGLNGKKFKIWKFRTMVTDAEKLQAMLEAQNEIKDGVLFKMKDDPRVTPLGKFLRRYSLDELPQIFNVLFGEMSFVGPRPLPVRDVEKFKMTHFIRQDVLPGITGWWQVSGRSNIDNFEDAVRLDISYIENWSLWFDLKILLKTVMVVVLKKGAY
jgi:exopolysaccharide biosynthesis polyprenyl glycosylphosphotransferase